MAIQRLREFLLGASARFEEKRVGEYDLHIHAESLGITDAGDVDGRRPVLVSLMGPGIGDEAIFEAEHADEGDQKSLIGFTPTHAVDVIAFCNRPVDHLVTALLTAAVMDVIGGVANAELREDQVAIRPSRHRRNDDRSVARRVRLGGIPPSVGPTARFPAPEVAGTQPAGSCK